MTKLDCLVDVLNYLVLLVGRFEGCHLKAYKCPAGIWTIGWGETLGVKEGDVWTQERADRVLRERLGFFLLKVLAKCPVLHLEPPERMVAATSLAYNIGLGAFGASSVARHSNAEQWELAAKAFLLWNKAGGRVLRGLDLRRQLESRVYALLEPLLRLAA